MLGGWDARPAEIITLSAIARRFPVEADDGSPKPRQTMADPQAGFAPSAGGAPSGAGGAPFGSDDEDDEDEPMPRVLALPEP